MEAALIRPVLRRLFWLAAEDRGLLLEPLEPGLFRRREELERDGSYRTRDAILDCYDRMDLDRFPGYQTAITPPPGQEPRHAPVPPGACR